MRLLFERVIDEIPEDQPERRRAVASEFDVFETNQGATELRAAAARWLKTTYKTFRGTDPESVERQLIEQVARIIDGLQPAGVTGRSGELTAILDTYESWRCDHDAGELDEMDFLIAQRYVVPQYDGLVVTGVKCVIRRMSHQSWPSQSPTTVATSTI